MRWYLALIGVNNKEIMYKQSDYFFFPMSVCVRWYSMVLPSDFRIKQLQFYAANPIFFDEKGHAIPNRLVISFQQLKRGYIYNSNTMPVNKS